MTDRAQTGHTGGVDKDQYATEAAWVLSEKETQVILSRIKGLFPKEMCDYVEILPAENRVVSALVARKKEMHMNNAEAQAWAKSLCRANQTVFETFVDKEQSKQVLTMIVEAEADREEPRAERIGYVNQRKQEL